MHFSYIIILPMQEPSESNFFFFQFKIIVVGFQEILPSIVLMNKHSRVTAETETHVLSFTGQNNPAFLKSRKLSDYLRWLVIYV